MTWRQVYLNENGRRFSLRFRIPIFDAISMKSLSRHLRRAADIIYH